MNHQNSNGHWRVQAKKYLGQHFLKNEAIAKDIASALLDKTGYSKVLEIGPGMGVLTKYLLQDKRFETWVVEIDEESISYLRSHYLEISSRIISEDFLRMDLEKFSASPFAIIGNFPYNISSQILFRVYENRNLVHELVGMFQKEVAQRVASGPGNKDYGILSVLLQAFYSIEYLFTVGENEFNPPPKVKSGVIRLVRNDVMHLGCDEARFKQVVKAGFNQRRKTLRNALKSLASSKELLADDIFNLRAEQLPVSDFIRITKMIFP
jgi:16S rRNA (adenine1518-N6/adenine1519-N6)-dimethyltransferase